jgi:hypothetical protein
MNPTRQIQRRALFQVAIEKMPTIETWDLPKVGFEIKTRKDFRFIPRWKRRDMARKLAVRSYRVTHHLA